GHHRIVGVAPPQQAAVDGRVQGLHAAVHDLRKTGDVADVSHRHVHLAQGARAAAGGDQFDVECVQCTAEVDQPGLVRDADECAPDGNQCGVEHEVAGEWPRKFAIIGCAVVGRGGETHPDLPLKGEL